MRPSRDEILLQHAELESTRGTCSRNAVGVVFARDGRVLITGFNGAPRGLPHCDHSCDCKEDRQQLQFIPGHDASCHSMLPCTISVHAEANAIAYAARHGVRLDGSDCYSTVSPCLACAQLLVNVGIKRLFYAREYRDHAGLNLLNSAGIVIIG